MAAVGLGSGCRRHQEDHPPVKGCTAEDCGFDDGASAGADVGNGGHAGEGGAGGQAGQTAGGSGLHATGVTLDIDVACLDMDVLDPRSATPLEGTFSIRAPGVDGTTQVLTGSVPAPMAGIRYSTRAWLSAEPTTPGAYWPGLLALDTTKIDVNQTVTIPVVARSDLELIGNLLTVPAIIDESAAQILVRFVQATSRSPILGVKVLSQGDELVVYDEQGVFSDQGEQTGSMGIALLLNRSAASGTGQWLQIEFGGATDGSLAVPLQAGFATFAEVAVE